MRALTSLLAAPAPTPPTTSAPTPPPPEPPPPPCWVEDPSSLCAWIYGRTGRGWLAESSDWLIVKPAKILLIVVLAVLARAVLHRVISRLAQRAAEGTVPGVLQGGRASTLLEATPLLSERRKQRADTMASVLRSLVTGAFFAVALLMILSELEVDIAPLLTSAGIAGVALGFGAQTLVKDFLSGIFMILEDQYGVGDSVDLGEASGVVEGVGLRVTRIRDVNGTVWYVRNGEILRVGNMSQGWARAVLDISVAYGEDVERVTTILRDVATRMWQDEAYADQILEEPEVWGVESISADAVVVRLVLKTAPQKQWEVARELRARIKAAFDEAGVEMPFPQRTVWMRTEGGSAAGAAAGKPAAPAEAPRA